MPRTGEKGKDKSKWADGKTKGKEVEATLLRTGRMEALWEAWKKQGIIEEELHVLLENSERDATSRSYDEIWARWEEFCRERQKNPKRYDVGLAVKFLGSLEERSFSYLRGDWKETNLSRLEEGSLCPVRCVEDYLKRTKAMREKSKSQRLFITLGKPHGDARGDTIARWIREVLRTVGIEAGAYSTTGVMASKAWYSGMSLEKIMRKANWRDASKVLPEATFERSHWSSPKR